MESTRIASTPLLGLRPLGSAADRSYERVCTLLKSRVGHIAEIISEPVFAQDGRSIDWYVQGAVEAFSMQSLSTAEREKVLTTYHQIRQTVHNTAKALEGSTNLADRNLGSVLINALTVPGDEFIYSVNGKPVLVAWGFSKENVVETSSVLGMRVAPRPAIQVPQQSTVSAPLQSGSTEVGTSGSAIIGSRPEWLPALLWIVFALLLALFVWLLLTVCHLNIPFVGQVRNPFALLCSKSVVVETSPQDRIQTGIINRPTTRSPGSAPDPRIINPNEALLQQLRDLESQISERLDRCTVANQAAAPDIETRLNNANARSGELQISLSWDGDADLDLYVLCNDGLVGATSRKGCGAELDVDMNQARQDAPQRYDSLTPVENIIWTKAPPRGEYKIAVELYFRRNDNRPEIPFKVRIRKGATEENISGTVSVLKQKKIIKVLTE
jgi:hypothetical protein